MLPVKQYLLSVTKSSMISPLDSNPTFFTS
jgi:hypothetical protein